MKIIKSISLLLFMGFWAVSINAQKVGAQVNENYEKNWSFGAGFNVVDDSGEFIGGLRDPSTYWNFSRPFYISAEYYLNNEFSFMAMVSFNAYNEGKQIDTYVLLKGEKAGYFATDLVAKYSFRDVLKTYKFDPYVSFGFGITNIGSFVAAKTEFGQEQIIEFPAASSFNLVGSFGINYWFNNTWGLNMNFAGKWHSGNDWGKNHKQYAIGAIYFLN